MMMTGRSRSRNSTQSRFITTGIIVVLVVLIGTLVGPYVRDLIVAARVSSDVYGKYALTPKSVLIERLDRAETELNRIRYQSVLYQSLPLSAAVSVVILSDLSVGAEAPK